MAYCSNCGKDISPAARACPNCGHPGPGAGGVATRTSAPTEGLAIASLVCSIAAFFFIPFIGSILAIVFGTIARRRIAEDPSLQGAEMARVGIIVGWVGLIVMTLLAIVAIWALSHWTLNIF